MPLTRSVLVLDAMGVIFQSGDDVAELLVPFLTKHSGLADATKIEELYVSASLGQISAEQFWHGVNLPPNLEDEYLSGHALNVGLLDFLVNPPPGIESIWCLSNDLSSWSRKLRKHFAIAQYFAGFVISGDIGCRKPDEQIYRALLSAVNRPANECIFVDDRAKNLRTAKRLGLRTVAFGLLAQDSDHGAEAVVGTFAELAKYLTERQSRCQ